MSAELERRMGVLERDVADVRRIAEAAVRKADQTEATLDTFRGEMLGHMGGLSTTMATLQATNAKQTVILERLARLDDERAAAAAARDAGIKYLVARAESVGRAVGWTWRAALAVVTLGGGAWAVFRVLVSLAR